MTGHGDSPMTVQAMKAGEHEEGGAVHAGVQFQVVLRIGMHVLIDLKAQEYRAQKYRCYYLT